MSQASGTGTRARTVVTDDRGMDVIEVLLLIERLWEASCVGCPGDSIV